MNQTPTTNLTRRSCDDLGVCNSAPGCACSNTDTPKEAGNVWFIEPKPETLGTADAIAIGVMLVALGVAVAGCLVWFSGAIGSLVGGS